MNYNFSLSRKPTDMLLWTFCALLGISMVTLPLLRYETLHSNFWDLGIFLTNIHNVSSFWEIAFWGHVQPLMLAYGQLFMLTGHDYAPQLLILSQSFIILASVFAIWRVYGNYAGIAMLLYPPLWFNVLFDFHFECITIGLLTGFFISNYKRRHHLATAFGLSLILVKEVYALQTIACGIYIITQVLTRSGQHGFVEIGSLKTKIASALILIVCGCVFYYISADLIPGHLDPGARGSIGISAPAFSWLGGSYTDIFLTLFLSPQFVLGEMLLNAGKIKYLVIIFGCLAFLPLLRPGPLIVAVPVILISLLSKDANYYSHAYHYTAGLIIPMVVAFSEAFEATINRLCSQRDKYRVMERTSKNTLPYAKMIVFTIVTLSHVLLSVSPFSRLFWSDKIWAYSYKAYIDTPRSQIIETLIKRHIPNDGNAVVTTQNSLNHWHMARRNYYLPFPDGVISPHIQNVWETGSSFFDIARVIEGNANGPKRKMIFADYVVLDQKRPLFLSEKGCDWAYGKCHDVSVVSEFERIRAIMEKTYVVIVDYDGFTIYKRFSE